MKDNMEMSLNIHAGCFSIAENPSTHDPLPCQLLALAPLSRAVFPAISKSI